ncbi:MARVEL-like domain protein [Ascosphaera apis ARSEF 7405]|uniref:MARVEL-like domain protein n=1 Tax=Ascosphaera apis ARSEF 7405 TaxID=392613 RepID=A0A167XZY1_9EURO|nr:MARVEL-like domain protein [Ascosphaera apis ARSEF 7405]
MIEISDSYLKYTIISARSLLWFSDVIVMGMCSYFINKYDRGQHITYDIVISTIGIVFHLPGFCSPFFTRLAWISLPIDVVWSYFYLTGFVFAAEDYNWQKCSENAPPGASCGKKRTLEAFLFFGFICSLAAAVAETWKVHQQNVRKNSLPAPKEIA